MPLFQISSDIFLFLLLYSHGKNTPRMCISSMEKASDENTQTPPLKKNR